MSESKLKTSAIDSMSELPNLLLREDGYPHLPISPIKQDSTLVQEMLNVLVHLYSHGYTTGLDHDMVVGVIKKAIGEDEFKKIEI